MNCICLDDDTYNKLLSISADRGISVDLAARKAIFKYGENEEENTIFNKLKFMSAVMAHQIMLPIQALLGEIDQLNYLLDQDPQIDSEIKEISSELKNSLLKLFLIAQNTIMQGKTPSENIPKFEIEKVNILSLINELALLFRKEAKLRNIEIEELCGTRSILYVDASRSQLWLAFANLIQNAIRYSIKDKKISISCSSSNNFIIIEITNIGVGIDRAELKNGLIFKKGYRGRHAMDHNIIGSGLGLSAAKEIIERHGGIMQIVSEKITNNMNINKVNIKIPISQEGDYVSKNTLD